MYGMEKIVGGILLLVGVIISLWIVFIVLKNLFGFSSIRKKVEKHQKQSKPSRHSIVESNFRLEETREALVTLDLNNAEIKPYRFVRQSMLEEESRDGFDLNNPIEQIAFGLINSKYRNYEKEETLWSRYGNAELYEVKIPCSFENYDLVFSTVFEMDRDTLSIHLTLEKELEVIITCKTFQLKESVVILKGTEMVKEYKEFDITYKFAFQSDIKYKHACIGDWLNIIALDGIPVEEV
jgi:hypothetical protein